MFVSPSTLKNLLSYNPETGEFFWKHRDASMFPYGNCKTWNNRYAGRRALTAISTTGYYYGNIFNKKHFAHRVALAICFGSYPEVADHINGNKLDNRILNLRFATLSGNARNVASSRGSSSKYLGVSWSKSKGRWYSCITASGKTKSLGRFVSEEDAARAYDAAAKFHYGEFARLNFAREMSDDL